MGKRRIRKTRATNARAPQRSRHGSGANPRAGHGTSNPPTHLAPSQLHTNATVQQSVPPLPVRSDCHPHRVFGNRGTGPPHGLNAVMPSRQIVGGSFSYPVAPDREVTGIPYPIIPDKELPPIPRRPTPSAINLRRREDEDPTITDREILPHPAGPTPSDMHIRRCEDNRARILIELGACDRESALLSAVHLTPDTNKRDNQQMFAAPQLPEPLTSPPMLITETLTHVVWSTSKNLRAATGDLLWQVREAVTDESQFADYFEKDVNGRERDMRDLIGHVVEMIGNDRLHRSVKAYVTKHRHPRIHEWPHFARWLYGKACRLVPHVDNSTRNLRRDSQRASRKRSLPPGRWFRRNKCRQTDSGAAVTNYDSPAVSNAAPNDAVLQMGSELEASKEYVDCIHGEHLVNENGVAADGQKCRGSDDVPEATKHDSTTSAPSSPARVLPLRLLTPKDLPSSLPSLGDKPSNMHPGGRRSSGIPDREPACTESQSDALSKSPLRTKNGLTADGLRAQFADCRQSVKMEAMQARVPFSRTNSLSHVKESPDMPDVTVDPFSGKPMAGSSILRPRGRAREESLRKFEQQRLRNLRPDQTECPPQSERRAEGGNREPLSSDDRGTSEVRVALAQSGDDGAGARLSSQLDSGKAETEHLPSAVSDVATSARMESVDAGANTLQLLKEEPFLLPRVFLEDSI